MARALLSLRSRDRSESASGITSYKTRIRDEKKEGRKKKRSGKYQKPQTVITTTTKNERACIRDSWFPFFILGKSSKWFFWRSGASMQKTSHLHFCTSQPPNFFQPPSYDFRSQNLLGLELLSTNSCTPTPQDTLLILPKLIIFFSHSANPLSALE